MRGAVMSKSWIMLATAGEGGTSGPPVSTSAARPKGADAGSHPTRLLPCWVCVARMRRWRGPPRTCGLAWPIRALSDAAKVWVLAAGVWLVGSRDTRERKQELRCMT